MLAMMVSALALAGLGCFLRGRLGLACLPLPFSATFGSGAGAAFGSALLPLRIAASSAFSALYSRLCGL